MLSYGLRQSLEQCNSLPSLPTAVLRVIELAKDPESSIQQIVATLGTDPALSVRVLSLANTVYFTRTAPVEELHQAVSRIGVERTLSMALGCSLISATDNRRLPGMDLERYWQRSLICALSAKSLAETLGLESEGGALYTASLLQDIGMLALYALDAERYRPLLENAMDHGALIDAERECYALDHAEVGAWLAARWNLPQRTVEWIAHSHAALTSATSREAQARNCLIASGRLADAWLEGEAALSVAIASLESYFGLDTPDMISKIMSLQEQLPSVAALYEVSVPQPLDANQLMFEAKLLLAEKNARLQQDLWRQQQEIEALRRQQEALNHQARVDPLTNLYNRRYMEQRLDSLFQQARAHRESLSLVFIDLDRFKDINDEFGHTIGDEVLKGFATILADMLKGDNLAGRYGGEEFIVVLPEADSEMACQRVSDIRRQLEGKVLAHARGVPIRVTASYGIASMEGGEQFTDVDELIETADQCMYRSKRLGSSRVIAVNSPTSEVGA
ncbi:diguanylate cyclase (GGDEF)-like protein [Modicisalibacter xianhensis]|uniref:diguanylate cyclase n=1 Tax=Modicisalibacter xianhensis TaxID=442341 RepID=A0A4R8G2I6_9GAMM|nr:GGDEF domain-containing protein [Halomonas xianhensis]TDX32333.1 diguanylate cyclase (GGDEF)-like protein [Halomonas xianhensis]